METQLSGEPPAQPSGQMKRKLSHPAGTVGLGDAMNGTMIAWQPLFRLARVAWHDMMPRRRRQKEPQRPTETHQGTGGGPSQRETGRSRAQAERPEPGKQRVAATRRFRPALPVRELVAAAARTGRRHVWRILAVAMVVSIVTALAEIAVDDLVDRANVPLSLLADLSASGVSLMGAVFLSGFLGKLVGEAEDGEESTSVRRVLRTLPWGRLVLADVLVVLLVVTGLIALVIPGLVAVNLFAVVGPVIEIENKPVIAALRRSAHLVRQHFWTVALLVTLPVAVASEIDSVAPDPVSLRAILEILAIRGLGEALAEAAIGLMLVKLCYRLIALDRTPVAAEGQELGDVSPAVPGAGGEGAQPGQDSGS
jgi:hypothetical protein